MNKKQLSHHIGNIDDKLVQQAERIPDYALRHRRKRIRRLCAAAAVLALMISSFSLGATVFAREIPAEQETLELEGVELTLILPDSWAGLYSVERYNSSNYVVYNTRIREAVSEGIDMFDGGVLFYIVCYDEAMTEEQFVENGLDFTDYRYILATRDKTYILHYASDVQYNPEDEEQVSIYNKMDSEIKDIQFIVSDVFAE